MRLWSICLVLSCLFPVQPLAAEERPLVIAHRGASGYLPEHTLAAKAFAYAQGADYIEQDVVMSRDNALIVFHDLILDRTTDVAERFPDRARDDGHFYVVDFDLAELRQIAVSEGFNRSNESIEALYPARFPPFTSRFRLHTLAEEIELVQGLNHSTGRNVGIYPELKSPWFHHLEDKDLATAVLQTLKDYDYHAMDARVFLQSFDYNELLRVHNELLPALAMEIPLVQLIADNSWNETFEIGADGNLIPYDYQWMHSEDGINKLARIVNGIGPQLNMLVSPLSGTDNPRISSLVESAHAAGLVVHPYTFRREATQIPSYATDFNNLLSLFIEQVGVDGLFTDFPDLVLQYLEKEE